MTTVDVTNIPPYFTALLRGIPILDLKSIARIDYRLDHLICLKLSSKF